MPPDIFGERVAESNPPAAARMVLRIRVMVERLAGIQHGKRWVWRFLAIAAQGRRNGGSVSISDCRAAERPSRRALRALLRMT
jgi:hypothetical protein